MCSCIPRALYVMPDIFVSSDTSDITSYYTQAVSKGLIQRFSFQYSDLHRNELSDFSEYEELISYLKRNDIVNKFVSYAQTKGLKARYWQIERSRKRLEQILLSTITYNALGMQEHIRYINTFDPVVKKAVEVLEAGNAFPQAPQ